MVWEEDFQNIRQGFSRRENNGVVYFSVPALDALGFVRNGFTTRIGGVSSPPYDSLNLSFKRSPVRQDVIRNFSIASEAMGIDFKTLVVCNYEHGKNVEFVGKIHHGMGILRENELPKCDGVIVTDSCTAGVTIHADCCPIFFADRKGRAAGVCHAGWKGTYLKATYTIIQNLKGIGVETRDTLFGIGPSICGQCYEVKIDVADLFREEYEHVVTHREGKLYLDLPRTLACQLLSMEVPSDNITLSGLCTYCDSELFYSHRRDGKNAGAMGAFISLC